MTRRCSHCSNNGHNSRTCPSRGVGGGGGVPCGGGGGGGVKLFGVRLTDGSIIKKSASMGNLTALHHHCSSPSSSVVAAANNLGSPCSDQQHEPDGYLSDDPAHASSFANRRGERKKGVPWTEEEHRMFLVGLQKLGKGDWRGIARNFVVSRTPTQVASHAQKYFIRQSSATRRKRRSSLFDMVPDMPSDPPSVPEEQVLLRPSENSKHRNAKSQPSLNLSLNSEFEPMETASEENVEEVKANEAMMGSNGLTPVAHGFFPANVPVLKHQVLKPIPVFSKELVNVDELVGMSHLSIGETRVHPDREPSPLSLKLLGEPSRQSAFHVNAPVGGSDLNSSKNNAIQAV